MVYYIYNNLRKNMKNEKVRVGLFYLAMVIVIGSHLYMLAAGLPAEQMTAHAVLNIVAGIIFGVVYYR